MGAEIGIILGISQRNVPPGSVLPAYNNGKRLSYIPQWRDSDRRDRR